MARWTRESNLPPAPAPRSVPDVCAAHGGGQHGRHGASACCDKARRRASLALPCTSSRGRAHAEFGSLPHHGPMLIEPVQRQRIADICRPYGVQRLQMFGSAARGDETHASDVDLLVEFVPDRTPTGFALVDLRDELSSVFDGRVVDLAFPSVLDNPFRRRAVEPDLRPLFQ